MIHDLKPYPAYKDSGVPWLGEVPEHWEVIRLWRFSCWRKPRIGLTQNILRSLSIAKVSLIRIMTIKEWKAIMQGDHGDRRVKSGNLIFCCLYDETSGTVGFLEIERV